MSHKEFTTAKAESTEDPITFSIDGETYHCVPKPSWHVLRTISKAAVGGSEAVVRVDEFFRAVVIDEDLERLEAILQRKTNSVDAELIQQIIEYLAEAYTGRPTRPLSGSPAGRNGTGDGSKANSSSEAPTPTLSH